MTIAASKADQCTVFFADLAGSTQLYERIGDAVAFKLVEQCLQGIRNEVTASGGHVVKHTGDGILAVFRDANGAPEAAIRIHNMMQDLPRTASGKLAVRVAFHTGTVISSDSDVFGDTVNIAARLLELATPGRAITSAETALNLNPEWKALLHPIPSRSLRGISRLTTLFELLCESTGDLTVVQTVRLDTEEPAELQLRFAKQSLTLNAQTPTARLGRDSSSNVRVTDTRASREHAYIELRGDKFVLIDRSSNGTFVAIEGEREFVLSHEEVVLRKQGHLALGRSCASSPEVISFSCL